MTLYVDGDSFVTKGIQWPAGETLTIKWLKGGETRLGAPGVRGVVGIPNPDAGTPDVVLNRPNA